MTFALLAAALTLLAPPAAAAPPAPVLLELRPDAEGRVFVAVSEWVAVKVQQVTAGELHSGNFPVTKMVDLAALKGLTVTTAGGKAVDPADAFKPVHPGAVIVVSADGQPVDVKFLKLLGNDTLVVAGKTFREATAGKSPAPYFLDLKSDAKGDFVRTVAKYNEIPVGSAGVRIPMLVQERFAAQDLPATTAGGEPVAPADAAKAYAAGATVIVSADGQPVDAKFLKLFKADVLVLTVKALALVSPPAPK